MKCNNFTRNYLQIECCGFIKNSICLEVFEQKIWKDWFFSWHLDFGLKNRMFKRRRERFGSPLNKIKPMRLFQYMFTFESG